MSDVGAAPVPSLCPGGVALERGAGDPGAGAGVGDALDCEPANRMKGAPLKRNMVLWT